MDSNELEAKKLELTLENERHTMRLANDFWLARRLAFIVPITVVLVVAGVAILVALTP